MQFAWFRDKVNGKGMTADPNADAILLYDIDMSEVCGADAGVAGTRLNWKPIGTRDVPYSGDFNGNGKKLTNLYIYNPLSTYQALFGHNNGTIRNLTIESGTIQSSNAYLAALAAVNSGNIYNCLSKASITIDNSYAGGLVHKNDGGAIINSVNMGDVICIRSNSNQGVNIGGIAGVTNDGIIINCYNSGNIDAKEHNRAAGISGIISGNAIIQNCYNTGTITGVKEVGGLVGLVNNVTTWNGVLLANNYCLENTCESLLGVSDFAMAEEQGSFVTQTELQNLAGGLGNAYQADEEPVLNGGYPVLEWQISGTLASKVSEKPVIQSDLSNDTIYRMLNSVPEALTVEVQTPQSGSLSYQWYGSSTATNHGFTSIEGETEASFSPPTTQAGPTWYYVIVTNTESGKETAIIRSEVASVVITEALTIKLDGQELTGDRIESIVEEKYSGGLDAAKNVKRFEVLSGTFTTADYNYLFNTLVNSNTNTGVSVIFSDNPSLDVSEVFAEGINRMINSKLFRLEMPGVSTLNSLGMTGIDADADRLPTLYMPDVIEILPKTNTGAFRSTNAATLYFPKLETIGDYSFMYVTEIKNLILPGDIPTVNGSRPFYSGNSGDLTVWVPADKVSEYKNAEDGEPDDGMWYWCNVRAFRRALMT